jgi:DNA-3-methyladenine glycosylase II
MSSSSLRRSTRLSTKEVAQGLDPAVPNGGTTPKIKTTTKRAAKAATNTAKKRKTHKVPAETSEPVPENESLESTFAIPQTPAKRREEKPRPAAPQATNAPLSTPGGSRVLAYSSSLVKPLLESQDENASPSKKRRAQEPPPDVGVLLPPTSTTETLLQDACEHLCKVDPNLKSLVDRHHCGVFSPEGLKEVVEPFTALASGIIGQQVSGQAAASIRKKFTALFPSHPEFPSPSLVIELDIPTLRTAGLSQRKAEYIHGLAEKFASGELSAQMLITASDEELIEKLVAVRGLGRWSVEMFACFGLKRMDVFSTGDLGIQYVLKAYFLS